MLVPPTYRQIHTEIGIRRHVEVLSEIIGERNTAHPGALEATRAYLKRELGEMGLEVAEHPFATTQRRGVNLEVVLPGSRANAPTLVVGAHYDSALGTPGADDNASAVAILLEIVRGLSSRSRRRTVRCIFYDCEEPPHFNLGEMGSQHHAQELRQHDERLLGMICLESLGYFPRKPRRDATIPWHFRLFNRIVAGQNVVIVSNLQTIPFGLRFLWSFVRSGFFPFIPAAAPPKWIPSIGLSDHRGYWEQGYRALMVTNTAFLRNPNYHESTDRLATLDLERMAALCRTLTGCVSRLAL